MSNVTVLVVAATPIMRAGVQSLLADATDIVVIGEANNRTSLTMHLMEQAPNVVLVCLDQFVDMNVHEVVRLVKTIQPTSKTLLLAGGHEGNAVRTAIIAGMDGFLPFGLEPSALTQGIRDVVRYGLILAEDLARAIRLPDIVNWPVDTLTSLSKREHEVLRYVACGRANLEIAQELHISLDTVRTHLKHIYGKLGVDSRSTLVRVAVHAGLGDTVDDC